MWGAACMPIAMRTAVGSVVVPSHDPTAMAGAASLLELPSAPRHLPVTLYAMLPWSTLRYRLWLEHAAVMIRVQNAQALKHAVILLVITMHVLAISLWQRMRLANIGGFDAILGMASF